MSPLIVDKVKLQRTLSQRKGRSDLLEIVEPTMTPQELRTRMEAMGVDPEDNIGSCGIIAARNGE